MSVIFTAPAEADLEAIADYIAKDNPTRALSFINELRFACEYLVVFPKSFAIVPRYKFFGVRRHIHGNYLIFFRLIESNVLILRIVHGAMNFEDLLFGQN